MAGLDQGHFEVINPYNGRISQVPSNPDRVHSIVFWSKNFSPFLARDYGSRIEKRGYPLFFNFTINSPHELLEPAVPALKERLDQLARLSNTHGPECIQWRFDPICCFKDDHSHLENNLGHFKTIAKQVAKAGISTCITSFVDLYRKVQRRVKRTPGIMLLEPPLKTQIRHITEMAAILTDLNIQLHLCCEPKVLKALGKYIPVQAASCIPNLRLTELYGPGIDLRQDSGQRKAAGCQCGTSKDIGSYSLHPCHHNCLFCYANPTQDQ